MWWKNVDHTRKKGREREYLSKPPHCLCVVNVLKPVEKKGGGGGAVSKWCWRAERRHRAFEMSAAADFGASMPAFSPQIRAPWDPGEQRETCTVTAAAGMWTTSHTEAKDEPAPCLLILLGFFPPSSSFSIAVASIGCCVKPLGDDALVGFECLYPRSDFSPRRCKFELLSPIFFFFPFCSPTLRQ